MKIVRELSASGGPLNPNQRSQVRGLQAKKLAKGRCANLATVLLGIAELSPNKESPPKWEERGNGSMR